jgi:hypothetical protein
MRTYRNTSRSLARYVQWQGTQHNTRVLPASCPTRNHNHNTKLCYKASWLTGCCHRSRQQHTTRFQAVAVSHLLKLGWWSCKVCQPEGLLRTTLSQPYASAPQPRCTCTWPTPLHPWNLKPPSQSSLLSSRCMCAATCSSKASSLPHTQPAGNPQHDAACGHTSLLREPTPKKPAAALLWL